VQREAAPPSSGPVIAVGLAIGAVFVSGLLLLLELSTYEVWGAMFVAPILLALSLPVFARQAAREADRRLFLLLILALVLKMAGGMVRHFVAFEVYEGVADAAGYHDWGVRLSRQFWAGNFDTGLESLTGTNFLKFLPGIVYMVTGPTRLGGFIFFSWLGFWGLFLFYRAFTIAVPEGRNRTYARLLFFLPTLVFWPSSIGKESWLMLCLGIAAYGSARALTGRPWRGLALAALGLWLAAIVRPHIAGMMGVGLAAAFLVRRPARELGQLAPIVKVASVAVVAALAVILVVRTDRFLRESNIDTDTGVTDTLSQITAQTYQGGSTFVPSLIQSPARAPLAVLTVLFRPFPFEAHNAQTVLAGLEGIFLLGLSLLRIPWGIGAVKSLRRQPYAAFALAYTGTFIFAFSAIANFGILVRQRSLMFPLFLVLLAIPPRRKESTPVEDPAVVAHA
jgi:hypothetical protein